MWQKHKFVNDGFMYLIHIQVSVLLYSCPCYIAKWVNLGEPPCNRCLAIGGTARLVVINLSPPEANDYQLWKLSPSNSICCLSLRGKQSATPYVFLTSSILPNNHCGTPKTLPFFHISLFHVLLKLVFVVRWNEVTKLCKWHVWFSVQFL